MTAKDARSGPLVFVTVRHQISTPAGVAVEEDQDIVYRGLPAPGAAVSVPAAPRDEVFARAIVPDDVLLFRYSALTFNGHRIHYDRRYVTAVEGLSGADRARPADRDLLSTCCAASALARASRASSSRQ